MSMSQAARHPKGLLDLPGELLELCLVHLDDRSK